MPHGCFRRRVVISLALLLMLSSVLSGQGTKTDVLILGLSSTWRHHYRLKPPVLRKGGKLEEVQMTSRGRPHAKWLQYETAPPPKDWTGPDFDDVGWDRTPASDPDSPWVSLLCMRGEFTVVDPAKAEGLRLSVSYRGGIVVHLNGTELARGHLKKHASPDDLAEDYPKGELKQSRTLSDVALPTRLLRKGTNVLALEIHRAALDESAIEIQRRNMTVACGTCGLVKVRLTAPDPRAVTPNVTRPAGLQVWNSDPAASDFDVDHGDPNEPLRPIRLVAPRAGVASGKVVVGADQPIQGLSASVTDLGRKSGAGHIPAAAVQIRYALPTSHEEAANWTYTVNPGRFDALEEVPPEEVPVRRSQQSWRGRSIPDEPAVVFGAVQPVWVTVRVPAEAAPGDYEGELTIRAGGGKRFSVPVHLRVSPWRVPDPTEYATFVEIVQSPESVAFAYDVPLWSEAHLKLAARSLDLLRQVGNRTCHVPLISDTNQGNDESMVRWIRRPDGTFTHDYTVMEKYLDLVEEHQGKPTVVCFYVWDTYLEGGRGGPEQWASDAVKEDRKAHAGEGPLVTLLDPATGKVEKTALPPYRDPKSPALWQPVFDEIRKRMKRRGLERAMMIGIMTDNVPTEAVVDFFKKVCPGVPWVSHAHPYRTEHHGVPVAYSSGVWSGGKFASDPSEGRTYGWQRAHMGTHFPRSMFDSFAQPTWRFMGEMNVTGQQRGFSRLGADFFAVLKDRRGRSAGRLAARFPKTSWRNLDIHTTLFYPGKNGPVTTARFEMLREGLQECEARIFIEKALTDPDASGRARLGEPLAGRVQDLLDERIRNMRRAVSTLRAFGGSWTSYAYIDNSWWQASPLIGAHWFVSSDWQSETDRLYVAADEVSRALHRR